MYVNNPDEVCHYTDLDGLVGILDSEEIHATLFLDVDDLNEFRHIRILLKPLLEKAYRDAALEFFKRYGSSYNFSDDIFNDDLGLFIKHCLVPIGKVLHPFLFCSSVHNNDNGILSQWLGHTINSTGYGIVFNFSNLSANLSDGKLDHSELVTYSDCPDEWLASKVNENIEVFISFLKMYIWNGSECLSGQTATDNWIEFVIEAAAKYKHPLFINENEYRFIFWKTDLDNINIDTSRKKSKSYITKKIDLKSINRVIVGPSPSQDYLYDRLLTHEKIMAHKIMVVKSSTF